jgi:hypothetical protein
MEQISEIYWIGVVAQRKQLHSVPGPGLHNCKDYAVHTDPLLERWVGGWEKCLTILLAGCFPDKHNLVPNAVR